MYYYNVYGLKICSDIEFPELDARRDVLSNGSDLSIVAGAASEKLEGSADSFWVEHRGDQIALMVPEVATYLIKAGKTLVICPLPSADPALLRLYVLGPALALACHQRGLVPLHASGIEYDDEVVAFIGSPGQGKSSVAAHCLGFEGTRLAADDILVVDLSADRRAIAHPGLPAVKLWRDALNQLGQDTDGLRPDWYRANKFHLPVAPQILDRPKPLKSIYVLEEDPNAKTIGIEIIGGGTAAMMLIIHTFRIQSLDDAFLRKRHFESSSQLASMVTVKRIVRNKEVAKAEDVAVAVLSDLRKIVQ